MLLNPSHEPFLNLSKSIFQILFLSLVLHLTESCIILEVTQDLHPHVSHIISVQELVSESVATHCYH